MIQLLGWASVNRTRDETAKYLKGMDRVDSERHPPTPFTGFTVFTNTDLPRDFACPRVYTGVYRGLQPRIYCFERDGKVTES